MVSKAELSEMSIAHIKEWRETFISAILQNKSRVRAYIDPKPSVVTFISLKKAIDALEALALNRMYLSQLEGELERRNNATNK